MINQLLAALKQRIRAGNVLHTDEQLLLFGGCAQRQLDAADIPGSHDIPREAAA